MHCSQIQVVFLPQTLKFLAEIDEPPYSSQLHSSWSKLVEELEVQLANNENILIKTWHTFLPIILL